MNLLALPEQHLIRAMSAAWMPGRVEVDNPVGHLAKPTAKS
jgi:hypothetical protein